MPLLQGPTWLIPSSKILYRPRVEPNRTRKETAGSANCFIIQISRSEGHPCGDIVQLSNLTQWMKPWRAGGSSQAKERLQDKLLGETSFLPHPRLHG